MLKGLLVKLREARVVALPVPVVRGEPVGVQSPEKDAVEAVVHVLVNDFPGIPEGELRCGHERGD